MTRIYLTEEMIAEAKNENEEFQEQKVSDKVIAGSGSLSQKAKDAWIGAVGELGYEEYCFNLDVDYEREPFVKTATTRPDFIIDGLAIDVKTTRNTAGMFVQPSNIRHDVYVCFRTSWTVRGKAEDRELKAIFERGEQPYLEMIGFSLSGMMKNLLKGTPPKVWRDEGMPMWRDITPHDCRSPNTKVFPQCLLFAPKMLKMALVSNSTGQARFKHLLR